MLSFLGTTTLISVMNSVLFSSHPHQHVLTFALIDLGQSNCGKKKSQSSFNWNCPDD